MSTPVSEVKNYPLTGLNIFSYTLPSITTFVEIVYVDLYGLRSCPN